MRTSWFVAAVVLLTRLALCQSPPKSLSQDDPDLFHAFFSDAVAQNAVPLNAADAPKLGSILRVINQDLNTLDGQRRAYLDRVARANQAPNARALQGYAATRRLMDLKGIRRLQAGISNRGWRELRDYINGPFRQKVNAPGCGH